MPTTISGHYIPAVTFNLEDTLAATRTPKGWVLDLINREHIAANPEHDGAVTAFARDNFFQAKDNLWINPKPLLSLFSNGKEVTLNAGHGLLTYDAHQVDVPRLAAVAGLTQVSPHGYVRIEVAQAMDEEMIFFGLGDCASIPADFHERLCADLSRAGWVRYPGKMLLNPVKFATREEGTVTDDTGTGYLLACFDAIGRNTIDALPWETRGAHQINPLALRNVEPYKMLISPRLRELCEELVAA